MKFTLQSILLAFFFVACTPAEILLVEELTEETVRVEKDLLGDPPQATQASSVELKN